VSARLFILLERHERSHPMDTAGVREVKPGGAVLRIIGVLLVAAGLWKVLALAALFGPPRLRDLAETVPVDARDYVLGLFSLAGPWFWIYSGLLISLFLFAGVQLLRLRRSGWKAAAYLAGYSALSVLVFAMRDPLREVILRVQSASDSGSSYWGMVTDTMIDRTNVPELHAWFLFVLYLTLLAWLFSGRRRFQGEPRRTSRRAQILKVAVSLLVIGLATVGTSATAKKFIRYRLVLSKAEALQPVVRTGAFEYLSEEERAGVSAALIRRLLREQTDAVADFILDEEADEYLMMLTPEDTRQILETARTARSVTVRACCHRLLASIGTREAFDLLTEIVNGPRGKGWVYAAHCFATMKGSRLPEDFLDLARKKDRQAVQVLCTLRECDDPRAAALLVELSRSDHEKTRREAIVALWFHPGPESERALQRALDDNDESTGTLACTILARIGTAASVSPLIEVLNRESRAVDALEAITGQDTPAEGWQAWWKTAEPTFSQREVFARQLLKPGFVTPDTLQSPPAMIQFRQMRELAPDLVRYLRRSEQESPYRFIAGETLTQWQCREGIEWAIDSVHSNDLPSNRIIRELGRATGVNFFGDKTRWRQWWKENRDRFPSAADAGKP
jgi:hypothetical protein